MTDGGAGEGRGGDGSGEGRGGDGQRDVGADDGQAGDGAGGAGRSDDGRSTPRPASDGRVLVPVRVLEGEPVADGVVDLLSTVPVVLLGYHVIPEQTAPGQARIQFEDRARAALGDLAATFEDAGADVETRLVFTHDREQTLGRVAAEEGCAATLLNNPRRAVESVLVSLGGDVDVDSVAGFAARLLGGTGRSVTLLYATADPDETAARTQLETAADRLVAAGLDPGAVTEAVVATDDAVDAVGTAAADHDAVVMGERAPSLRSLLFGDPGTAVARESLGPVLVVRGAPARE